MQDWFNNNPTVQEEYPEFLYVSYMHNKFSRI